MIVDLINLFPFTVLMVIDTLFDDRPERRTLHELIRVVSEIFSRKAHTQTSLSLALMCAEIRPRNTTSSSDSVYP